MRNWWSSFATKKANPASAPEFDTLRGQITTFPNKNKELTAKFEFFVVARFLSINNFLTFEFL